MPPEMRTDSLRTILDQLADLIADRVAARIGRGAGTGSKLLTIDEAAALMGRNRGLVRLCDVVDQFKETEWARLATKTEAIW